MSRADEALTLSWEEAWLTAVVATSVYMLAILLTRLFGQRQLLRASAYDLAFVFAVGTLMGRVILVRTSLAGAALGLVMMFSLHAVTGWLHHHSALAHRLSQNRPILLVAKGKVVDQGLRTAKVSGSELLQQLRLHGHGSLSGIQSAILERNGQISVIGSGAPLDQSFFSEVRGADRLELDPEHTTPEL